MFLPFVTRMTFKGERENKIACVKMRPQNSSGRTHPSHLKAYRVCEQNLLSLLDLHFAETLYGPQHENWRLMGPHKKVYRGQLSTDPTKNTKLS